MILDIEFDGFVLDLVCYICYEDFFFCCWVFERIFIYLRMKSKWRDKFEEIKDGWDIYVKKIL